MLTGRSDYYFGGQPITGKEVALALSVPGSNRGDAVPFPSLTFTVTG
jgi:hypothetical protein